MKRLHGKKRALRALFTRARTRSLRCSKFMLHSGLSDRSEVRRYEPATRLHQTRLAAAEGSAVSRGCGSLAHARRNSGEAGLWRGRSQGHRFSEYMARLSALSTRALSDDVRQ